MSPRTQPVMRTDHGVETSFLSSSLVSSAYVIRLNQILPDIQKVIDQLKDQIKETDEPQKRPAPKKKKRSR